LTDGRKARSGLHRHPQTGLDDLRERLRPTRWSSEIPGQELVLSSAAAEPAW